MMKFKGAADSFMESFNRKVAERKAEQERQRALMETQNMIGWMNQQGYDIPATATAGQLPVMRSVQDAQRAATAATLKVQQTWEEADAEAATYGAPQYTKEQMPSASDYQASTTAFLTKQGKDADLMRTQTDEQNKLEQEDSVADQLMRNAGMTDPGNIPLGQKMPYYTNEISRLEFATAHPDEQQEPPTLSSHVTNQIESKVILEFMGKLPQDIQDAMTGRGSWKFDPISPTMTKYYLTDELKNEYLWRLKELTDTVLKGGIGALYNTGIQTNFQPISPGSPLSASPIGIPQGAVLVPGKMSVYGKPVYRLPDGQFWSE